MPHSARYVLAVQYALLAVQFWPCNSHSFSEVRLCQVWGWGRQAEALSHGVKEMHSKQFQ